MRKKDEKEEPDYSLSDLSSLPMGAISEEEEIRRRRLAEETARRIGKRWSQPNPSKPRTRIGKIPPIVLTIGSIVLFFVLAAFRWNWAFAAGITALIFVHECGHVWGARKVGFPVTGMIFVPFLGAYVTTLRDREDRESDAFVALMGPVFGALAGVICVVLAYALRKAFFLDLAIWSFGVNLLNLLPIPPLDGRSIAPVLVATVRHSRFDRSGEISATAKKRLSAAYIGLAILLAAATYKLPDYPFLLPPR